MVTKFWMKQNGVVGTAHRNRDGQTVDFRPAEKSAKLESRNGNRVIVLTPSKDVEIESLVMPASLAERKVIADEVCLTKVRETWGAEFEGVKFSCTDEVWEDKNTPEAEASREAARARDLASRSARSRRDAFVSEQMAALTAVVLVAIAQPTAREWGKLESTNWKLALSILMARAHKAFDTVNFWVRETLFSWLQYAKI